MVTMRRFRVVFSILSCLYFAGCVPVLVAGVGVVTGYVAFKDTAAGNIEAAYDDIWEAAVDILQTRAKIVSQDKERGIFKATAQGDVISITVKVIPLAQNSYKLKVTARRRVAVADLETAQNIFTAIVRAISQSDPDGAVR
jgi:hypothetical protein